MVAVAGVGVVKYNGYQFPPKFNAQAQGVPVYDTANRTVKHTLWTFIISAVITPDQQPLGAALGNNRTNMVDIRNRLAAPGRDFEFSDQGLGDIKIVGNQNRASGDSLFLGDIAFGPKPRMINWTPLGSNQAARVVWQVEVALVNCTPGRGVPRFGNPSEFSWGVNWSIDEGGMTVRTISGLIEIPGNRLSTSSVAIADTADRYRERLVNFPTPPGFRRGQQYNLSPDRRILQFTITDTEVPSDNPLFPGCVRMDVRHRVSGGLFGGSGYKLWRNTLSGTIEVRPGEPRSTAWQAFRIIVNDRIQAVRRGRLTTGESSDKLTKPAELIAIETLDFEEDIYGRTLTFNVSWRIQTDLSSLFAASGLWQPVPGANWNLWKASMESVTGVRGRADMGHVQSDDVIVSLCDAPVSSAGNSLVVRDKVSASDDVLDTKCPPPETSWLECHNKITTHEFHGTIQHTPTAPSGGDFLKWYKGLSHFLTSPTSWTINQAISASTRLEGTSTTQVRAAPRYEVWLEGWALRVGFAVPVPVLVDFGGQKPLLAPEGNKHSHSKVGDMNGCPVYFSQWRRIYLVDEPPSGDIKAQAVVKQIPLECEQ